MKYRTPINHVILVCSPCEHRGGPTVRSCPNCSGMFMGVYEDGEWRYIDTVPSNQSIAERGWVRIFRRMLIGAALTVAALFLLFGGLLLSALVRDPRAIEYTWLELLVIDKRVVGCGYGALLASMYAFALYVRAERLRTTLSVSRVSSAEHTPITQWFEARHLPRHARRLVLSACAPDIEHALEAAFKKAQSQGSPSCSLTHVIWGLCSTSSVRTMLFRLGFSAAQVQSVLLPAGNEIASTTEPSIEYDVWQALFTAYADAYAARDLYVSAPSFFRALIERSTVLQDWFYGIGIDADMVDNVVAWTRFNERLMREYRQLSRAANHRPRTGMDKAMTAIATPLLNQCSEDITLAVHYGHGEPCVARDKEFEELLRIVAESGRPALLVGDHGIGKKSMMIGLAERMIQGTVPASLQDKRLVRLSTAAVVSGTTAAGAMERLMIIMEEVYRARNVVLCIDQVNELLGISAGSGQSLDVGGALSSLLSTHRVPLIATCTPDAYSKTIATTALGSVFVPIHIREMDDNQAVQALESKTAFLESRYDVAYTYGALAKAVALARRFMHEHPLPGSALQILTEAGILTQSRRKTIVVAETVAEVVAEKTHIPVTSVASDESARLLHLENALRQRVVGQDEAVRLVAQALRRARAEIRSTHRPIANFLFLGPTGVGKTELTKTIADEYFGGVERMIRLDMSEYQDTASVYRLIGSPGSQGSGVLTEAVRRAPFSLILLDELEKAHKDILNVFLQVLDDGRLTDSTGRTVDFTNTIIIATSNAGTGYVADCLRQGLPTDVIKDRLIHGELRTYFRPEFLNRFDGIVLFKPLEKDHIRRIAEIMIRRVAQDVESRGISLTITGGGLDALATAGFDPEFGARPLRRAIEEHIENPLAELILMGRVGRRSQVVYDGRELCITS